MSLLFETLKCQNRQLHNVQYHDNRVKLSRENLLGISGSFDFENTIEIPDWVGEGLYRCRVSYAKNIEKVEFFAYEYKHPKIIQLHENQTFSYGFKYENRCKFSDLLKVYPMADDVIITQNNCLTDATYANVAFYDGSQWFTPNTYLLAGTKRSYMIDNQILTELKITFSDVIKFQKIALINAMRGLELAYRFSFDGSKIIVEF